LRSATARIGEAVAFLHLDLTLEKGKEQFETLFKMADKYDRLLKDQFGCVDRLKEK